MNKEKRNFVHKCLSEHVKAGDICIDITPKSGKDTAFLCDLVGNQGQVLVLAEDSEDITSTEALLSQTGIEQIAQVVAEDCSSLHKHVAFSSVACMTFRDQDLEVTAELLDENGELLHQLLRYLKRGGLMAISLMQEASNSAKGRYELLNHLHKLDDRLYEVIFCEYYDNPEICCYPISLRRLEDIHLYAERNCQELPCTVLIRRKLEPVLVASGWVKNRECLQVC